MTDQPMNIPFARDRFVICRQGTRMADELIQQIRNNLASLASYSDGLMMDQTFSKDHVDLPSLRKAAEYSAEMLRASLELVRATSQVDIALNGVLRPAVQKREREERQRT